MINLLPPEFKSSYSYARRNLALRGWIIALLFVLVGVGALGSYGLWSMQDSINNTKKEVSLLQEQLEKENLAATQNQVKEISGSLSLAAQVLSKEVLFSKLIAQIGTAMPRGAVLSSLNINQTSGGLDLSAKARDYQTASQVQVNMASRENKIFASADLVSIDCGGADAGAYPCTVTLRALFNEKNQFLFINQGVKP